MKKAIGFDLEYHAAGAIPPSGEANLAAMIVVGWRSALNGKRAETVVSHQLPADRVEGAPIEGAPDRELQPAAKG